MQKAQFERIFTRMARDFGTMRKGSEEDHAMILFPMESNALKVHRQFPDSNSRRLREAIALALYGVQEHCGGRPVDVSKFRKTENERLEQALLHSFDPYANEEVMEVLRHEFGGEPTPDDMRAYYKVPVMCLLRIKDSIDVWERRFGSNGYFKFLEDSIGSGIKGTDMHFTVALP